MSEARPPGDGGDASKEPRGITEWLDSLVLSTEFAWTMLAIIIVLLIVLGEPLYVVLGSITAYLLLSLPDFPPYHDFAGALKEAIAICEEEHDYQTREILEKMLADTEEDHAYWLEQQLGLIEKIGLQNYLQSQI